jgi:hypothetical protein
VFDRDAGETVPPPSCSCGMRERVDNHGRRPYARHMRRAILSMLALAGALWAASAGGTVAAPALRTHIAITRPCSVSDVPHGLEQVDIAGLDGPFVVPASLRRPPLVEFIAPPVAGATVTDALGLFASGPLAANQVYDRNYRWAGSFALTVDTTAAVVNGRVDVKMRAVPRRAAVGHRIAVQWATSRPRGYVFDIQRRTPGSRHWRLFRSGTKRLLGCATPSRSGTYHWRARMRKASSGAHSRYSPAIRVRITS